MEMAVRQAAEVKIAPPPRVSGAFFPATVIKSKFNSVRVKACFC